MNLAENYYHCFLGNGLDAVLVGYSGAMVPEKVGVDRCVWYKSDRYYPEDKLVMVAGRFPLDKPLEHAQGSGWYEIAPLGRSWYEVFYQGQRLEIISSDQHFDPRRGMLTTRVDFGPVQATVQTWMHATRSLLVEKYEFSQDVDFTAWMAPGIWQADGWDSDPFRSVQMDAEAAHGCYDLDETKGEFFLHLEPARPGVLADGAARGLRASGRTMMKVFSILDNRQCDLLAGSFDALIAPGYAALLDEHLAFWQAFFSRSSVSIPDEQFQYLYDASMYHFKAAQNPVSGGLPVNNLRRTWSSHIFWDSFFIQQALLEANHTAEALESCRFFERTAAAARRHAQEEFGCPGLKWDWEVTHDGRKAYGTLLHMKFQAHNNGSYANELWSYYQATQDRQALQEFFPILEGLATFFMQGIVIRTEQGWEIGPLVGVHESPVKVKNEGTSLAATIAILEHYADTAEILDCAADFSAECRQAAAGLRRTLDGLFNGRYFVSAEGLDNINMSSMAIIFPLGVIAASDPRAVLSAEAVLRNSYEHIERNGVYYNFPWSWGVQAAILARQGQGDLAWKALQQARPTICQFGGMAEVMEGKDWNMQYFETAQAAAVNALHAMLLQGDERQIRVFPALPEQWQQAAFERLLTQGLQVSARCESGAAHGEVLNISPVRIARELCVNGDTLMIDLQAGERYEF
jgi:hypothetical protein